MVITSWLQFFQKVYNPTVKKVQDFKITEEKISTLPIRDFMDVIGPQFNLQLLQSGRVPTKANITQLELVSKLPVSAPVVDFFDSVDISKDYIIGVSSQNVVSTIAVYKQTQDSLIASFQLKDVICTIVRAIVADICDDKKNPPMMLFLGCYRSSSLYLIIGSFDLDTEQFHQQAEYKQKEITKLEVFSVDDEQKTFYISIYDRLDKIAMTLLYKFVVEKEENITLPKITVVLVIRNSKLFSKI